MTTVIDNAQQVQYPSVYFTAIWLQYFNPDLILERMDLVEAYIFDSYGRFIKSEFNSKESSELDCIEQYLSVEKTKNIQFKLTDD